MSWRENKDTVLAGHPYYDYVMGTRYDGYIPGKATTHGFSMPNRMRDPAVGADLVDATPNVPVLRIDKGRPDACYEGGYYQLGDDDVAREYAPFQRREAELGGNRIARVQAGLAAYRPVQVDLPSSGERGVWGFPWRLVDGGIPDSGSFANPSVPVQGAPGYY